MKIYVAIFFIMAYCNGYSQPNCQVFNVGYPPINDLGTGT